MICLVKRENRMAARLGITRRHLARLFLIEVGMPPKLCARVCGRDGRILSPLAEATTRIAPGTLVTCVPFHNPALVANMGTTLDEVSDGCFTLGLGAGWHAPEFAAFGVSKVLVILKRLTPSLFSRLSTGKTVLRCKTEHR
jgi:hypothetical protein